MNIVIYNFLQPGQAGGGGVGVYVQNLAEGLQAAGHRVIALSSGDIYGFTDRQPRLRTWRDGLERAAIVNAPFVAPAGDAFDDMTPYTKSSALDGFPALLRARFGNLDVFHFQNIEGLTRGFFDSLRAEFPSSRIIFSVHNYNTVCAQSDLWFQNSAVCIDYREGRACTVCLMSPVNSAAIVATRRYRPVVQFMTKRLPFLKQARRALSKRLKHDAAAETGTALLQEGDGQQYVEFRQSNIDLCASVFDHVLAASDRTRQVVVARGLSAGNLAVSYIGTAHKAAFERAKKISRIEGHLHIAYLGYMRASKGFHFLLDALEQTPDELASEMVVTVAARRQDDLAAYDRLMTLGGRFAELRYHDGFTHKTLDAVLTGVNLGIVPPLWEDNLPQVAIEMVSRGIPILTSDRGGAQEIARNPSFVFTAGSVSSMLQRWQALSSGATPLGSFWDGPINLFSMAEHIDDLARYYAPR